LLVAKLIRVQHDNGGVTAEAFSRKCIDVKQTAATISHETPYATKNEAILARMRGEGELAAKQRFAGY
jgi:hypothetical protein